jgi:tetratricopeptide (TPR) repeat protein
MEYLTLEIEINPWEGILYEIIGRFSAKITPTEEGVPVNRPLWSSAREVSMFPLNPVALAAQLPALRRALSSVDLRAGLGSSADERLVEEFATQLYHFVFTGELRRLLEEARAAAIQEWKGVRLRLKVTAPQLEALPWEVLWSILAFDLKTMRRGMFDLRVERAPRGPARGTRAASTQPPARLEPRSAPAQQELSDLLHQADAAFYSPDFRRAVSLYEKALERDPSLRQARESMLRADTCLLNREPRSTVPPRAAAGFRRAWDAYAQYKFDEALRWLNEAWLLAKDWGIAAWPEATAFLHQIERSRTGWANFQKGLSLASQGDRAGALEAVSQAYRADPLETYRAQLETWGKSLP